MSFQTYDYTALQAAVTHAIGRTPATGTTAGEIVNNAIQYVAHLHPWSWRKAESTIGFTSSQTYANLPTDFESLISLRPSSTFMREFRPVTQDELLKMRELDLGYTDGLFYYSISWGAQATVTAERRARVDLWPTPSSTTSDVANVFYYRLIPVLSSGTDLPDVPTHCMMLIKQFCRAFAVSDEDEQHGVDWERATRMLDDFKARDGAINSAAGHLTSQLQYGPVFPDPLYPYSGLA